MSLQITIIVVFFIIANQVHGASAAATNTGIIIPLYDYPGPAWNELIQAKNAHPSVPIVVIINPNNGPSSTIDQNYVTGIQHLQAAGITVLGYVYTSYGTRSISSIETDINSYNSWYHVSGINFDEMANTAGFETYYSSLSSYAKSLGMTMTVGNPGTDTLPSYIGTVNNLIIYDNPGLPPLTSFEGWYANYSKSNFSIISYSINSLNSTYVENAIPHVQYLYISNSTLPNPFTALPSFLDNLLSILDTEKSQNNDYAGSIVKTQPNRQTEGMLEINLMTISGERADYHGMALKIYQDNSNLPFKTIISLTGNPYNISLPLGHRYKIESYANSMLASIGYINLESNDEKLKLGVPTSGSLRFTVVYNDGYTPIDNATVMVKSTDGTYEYWTNSTTDNTGNTIRFWLQPTISNNNYYDAEVFTGNGLSYSYFPISVLPSLSSDLKIVTPWPTELPPIAVSVYKSNYQKITKDDGSFVVQLYDNNGNKISESPVDAIGDAYFANLKVGKYTFQAINVNDPNNQEWNTTSTLDGRQTSVQIFKITNNQGNVISNPNTSVSQIYIPRWVKDNAKWWAQNQVNDSDFVSGIQYLIQERIMKIPPANISADPLEQIPPWIKSNAAWWAQGQISDNDFIKGIQYLISNGIMKISNDSTLMLANIPSSQSDR